MSRTTQHVSYLKLEELSDVLENKFKHISILENDRFLLKTSIVGGYEQTFDVGFKYKTQKEITDYMINRIKVVTEPCTDLYQFDLVITTRWNEYFQTDYEFRVFAFL